MDKAGRGLGCQLLAICEVSWVPGASGVGTAPAASASVNRAPPRGALRPWGRRFVGLKTQANSRRRFQDSGARMIG